MKIITHTCPMCGTIVAANVLERRRQMKCPRFDCEYILEYEKLPKDDRQYFEQYQQKYTI